MHVTYERTLLRTRRFALRWEARRGGTRGASEADLSSRSGDGDASPSAAPAGLSSPSRSSSAPTVTAASSKPTDPWVSAVWTAFRSRRYDEYSGTSIVQMHACARGSESLGSVLAQRVKRWTPPLKPCSCAKPPTGAARARHELEQRLALGGREGAHRAPEPTKGARATLEAAGGFGVLFPVSDVDLGLAREDASKVVGRDQLGELVQDGPRHRHLEAAQQRLHLRGDRAEETPLAHLVHKVALVGLGHLDVLTVGDELHARGRRGRRGGGRGGGRGIGALRASSLPLLPLLLLLLPPPAASVAAAGAS